jgi:CRISPR-associated protein Cpf1
MNAKTSFSDFTNLYELSKTLRFELKPVGETKNNLEKD